MDTQNSAPALPPGTKLFGYEIVNQLGSGGFGIVYRATLLEIGGTVAIKEFLPAQLARRRADGHVEPLPDQVDAYQWSLEQFRKEARTLRALADPEPHPNIIKVELVFETNDTVYFSMRWEEGRPLDEVITPKQHWSETELRGLLLALLDGLERVHGARVLHRDIKPNNLLVRPDGSPVLIDFGAARRVAADNAQSRFIVQTPGFAPPEQAWGEYGPWTDIYALAASFFCVLTGDKPVAFGSRRRFLADILAGVYSPSFLAALDAALEPNHGQRPQDVTEWRRMLMPPGGEEATVLIRQPRANDDTVLAAAGGSHQWPGDSHRHASPDFQPGQTTSNTNAPARKSSAQKTIIAVGLLLVALAAAVVVWPWRPWAPEPAPTPALPAPPADSTAEPVSTSQPPPATKPAPTPGREQPSRATPATKPESTPPALAPEAQPTPEPATSPPPRPALPPAGDKIRAAVATLDCARIELNEVGERSFKMSGYVGGHANLVALRDALRRIPSIRVDIGGIEVLSSPACATLHALRPYLDPSAPSIRPSHPDGRYRVGDPFAVEVRNDGVHSGRLHLFFISADDTVMAFPNSFRKLLYKGDSAREAGFDVGGPPGTDMILGIWCRGGIELPDDLAAESTSSQFLPRLRAAMEAAGECGASTAIIRVRARTDGD